MSSNLEPYDANVHTHSFTFVIGDWSGDGHSIDEHIVIAGTVPVTDIKAAMRRGVDLAGLTEFWNDSDAFEFCAEYQDTSVPETARGLLEAVLPPGYEWENADDRDSDDDPIWASIDDWVEIHIGLLKLAVPGAMFALRKLSSVNIGGYGFFS